MRWNGGSTQESSLVLGGRGQDQAIVVSAMDASFSIGGIHGPW